MSEPAFLSVEQVERLQHVAIEKFGGLHGIRDQGLLESAVTQPQHVFFYGAGNLFEAAAAYAFHIGENQPFLDGNKRTGVAAAIAFLRSNGVNTEFDSMPLYEAMIAIAEKRSSKSAFASLLRRLVQ